jgi:hypothetical protein
MSLTGGTQMSSTLEDAFTANSRPTVILRRVSPFWCEPDLEMDGRQELQLA